MKQAKETSAMIFARADKFKRFAELNPSELASQTYKNVLKKAEEALTEELTERGKKFFNKQFDEAFGADWFELIRKQYPVAEIDGKFVVKSEARDWGTEKVWECDSMWIAYAKVDQLVNWLADGRKRGFGDTDSDVSRLTARLLEAA